MFIPRKKVVHENLATSYVLLDALVDDLCEGGFSGIVEVVLRDADVYVVIDSGRVIAAFEQLRKDAARDDIARARAEVAELAARSRLERGRVCVYECSAATAAALAGRLAAEPLYTRLSTDFADLERMIFKLSRERDREWFIEISAETGLASLLHIKDGFCRIISSEEPASEEAHRLAHIEESGRLDLSESSALRDLIEACNREVGAFDVYFKRPNDAAQSAVSASSDAAAVEASPPARATRADEKSPAASEDRASEASAPLSASAVVGLPHDAGQDKETASGATTGFDSPSDSAADSAKFADAGDKDTGYKAARPPHSSHFRTHLQTEATDAIAPGSDDAKPRAVERASKSSAPEDASEAEAMADIKRLFGDIAGAIEQGARAVEQRDSFSMYLRAGQLKIADRYPFLDPFGAEFEYLAGEIVFVGAASPQDFIAGLTQALKLAVIGVAESSAQPARLRARIVSDLNHLLESRREELAQYGLDQSIEQIISE